MAMIEGLIYVYKHLKIETSSSRQIMLMHDNKLSLTSSICNEKKQNSDCISESLGAVHQQAASTNKSIIHRKPPWQHIIALGAWAVAYTFHVDFRWFITAALFCETSWTRNKLFQSLCTHSHCEPGALHMLNMINEDQLKGRISSHGISKMHHSCALFLHPVPILYIKWWYSTPDAFLLDVP